MRLVVTLRGANNFVEGCSAHAESVHETLRAFRLVIWFVDVLSDHTSWTANSSSCCTSLLSIHAWVEKFLKRCVKGVSVRRRFLFVLLLRKEFRSI